MASRFLRVRALFDEAREHTPGEARERWLQDATGEDPELLEEVRRLLARHDAIGLEASAPPQQLRRAAEAALQSAADAGEVIGGARTFGPYEVVGVLGRGGMATVYRARQQQPARDVALKVLGHGAMDASAVARFRREARLLGRLRHDGIAQVYEFGHAETPDGPRAYIAMELVDGCSLTSHAARNDVDVEGRVDLLLQVLDALAEAHRRGVIHRDLKPANVLVTTRGRVKLLDFGVARDEEDEEALTRTGDVMGTLLYMSPEQVAGNGADIRSDIHAVGLLAHELFAGRRARDPGQPAPSLIESILRDDVPSLARVASTVPSDLGWIVDRAVQHDPERRYASAQAFADDLRRWQRSEPVMARPPTLTYQLRQFARRHRTLVFATTGIVAALSIGLVLALRAGRVAERERERSDRIAAERLQHTSTLEIQAAVTDLNEDRPRLAAQRLAGVPEQHRTWAWHYVKSGVEQYVSRLDVPRLPPEVAIGSIQQGRIVQLMADGRLVDTGETRDVQIDEFIARFSNRIQQAVPTLVRYADGSERELAERWLFTERDNVTPRTRFPARGTAPAYGVFGTNSLGVVRLSDGVRLPNVIVGRRPSCVALHPTDPLLLVGTRNRKLLVLDLETLEEVGDPILVASEVTAVAWAPDGSRLASVDDQGTVRMHAYPERTLVGKSRSTAQHVRDIHVSPDGQTVVGLTRTGIWSWRPLGDPLRVMRWHGTGVGNYVYALAISRDGRRVASAAWDGTVRIASLVTGELLATVDTSPDAPTDVAFVRDDQQLAIGTQNAIHLVDARTTERLASWVAKRRSRRMACVPDGSACYWYTGKAKQVMRLRLEPGARIEEVVALPPERRPVIPGHNLMFEVGVGVAGAEGYIHLESTGWTWRAHDTHAVLSQWEPPGDLMRTPDLVLHPDGKRLLSAGPGSTVAVYDLLGGTRLASLKGHTDHVFAVDVHPKGRVAASASNDSTVRIWDLRGSESVTLAGHTFYVHDVAFTPDGTTLVSASGDGTVRLWSTRSLPDRMQIASEERARARRLLPRIEALLRDRSSPSAAYAALDANALDLDEADQATAADLLLKLVGAATPR